MLREQGGYKKILLFSRICLAMLAWALIGCATNVTKVPPEVPSPGSIETIGVTSTTGEGITVIDITNSKPVPYTCFKLVAPLRVVLDIQGTPGKDAPLTTKVDDGNVSDIRLQSNMPQASSTRVVVGLSRALDYVVAEKGNVISLKLTPKIVGADTGRKAVATTSVGPQEGKTVEAAEFKAVKPRIFFKPRPVSLNQILGVDFSMLEHGKSRLTITTAKKAKYTLERKAPKTLLLTIEKSSIPSLLLRRLDSSQFEGAVDRVKPEIFSKEKRVSFAISLRERVPFHVDQTSTSIYVDFGRTSIMPPKKEIIPVKLVERQKGAHVKGHEKAGPAKEGARIPGLSRRRYTGVPMTMDFVNADVTNILRLIGEVSNLNIIWGPDVKGSVSMRLKKVPWDQALDLVLSNNDLAMRRQGNVIWVTSRDHMAKIEQEDLKKQKEMQETIKKAEELEPLITEYFPLDFANATKLSKSIVPSKRGELKVDGRTNTIILQDTARNIAKARKTVKRFDTPVKQIMIEARIVDASTNFSRDLGLRWNKIEGQRKKTPSPSMTWSGTPLWAPNNVEADFSAGNDLRYTGTFATNSPDGWSPNIGVTFARLTSSTLGGLALDASLALAETEGQAKIISAPKVIASNGETATISRGDVVYKPIATADTTDIKELEANLSLKVTPTVSFNNYVTMAVVVTDDKVYGDLSGKTKKSIDTKLVVKSGETIVIGGIFKGDTSEKETGIPWLRDIPIVGWLFKARSKSSERTELLIFLTPRVVPTESKSV